MTSYLLVSLLLKKLSLKITTSAFLGSLFDNDLSILRFVFSVLLSIFRAILLAFTSLFTKLSSFNNKSFLTHYLLLRLSLNIDYFTLTN